MVSFRNNVGPFSSAPVLFFHPTLVQFDMLQRFEFCSSSTLYIPTYLSNIIIHYVVLINSAVATSYFI